MLGTCSSVKTLPMIALAAIIYACLYACLNLGVYYYYLDFPPGQTRKPRQFCLSVATSKFTPDARICMQPDLLFVLSTC